MSDHRSSPDTPGVVIRRIRPEDSGALERFYAALSPESRRLRFFGIGAHLSHDQSSRFCTPDHHHREGFVAMRSMGGDPTDAARVEDEPVDEVVGHLCLEPDRDGTAEVAIAVADEYQRQGIGRRLMRAGMTWARHEGIARLTATMLAENQAIARLLASLGCPTRIDAAPDDLSSLVIELEVPGVAAA